MKRVVVIGAGVGGLTTAAVLARAGLDVTVLEAEVIPGGCASTFFHQGFRFDAGATLAAGFYPGGPMDLVAQAAGIESWPAVPADAAMVVHLPDGTKVTRWTGEARWEEYRSSFGSRSLKFFQWQEQAADALWNLALRLPAWPAQSIGDFLFFGSKAFPWLFDRGSAAFLRNPNLGLDAVRSLAAHLHSAPDALRLFVDAQLLISAQVPSERANALYGAAALDLPRRGVVHLAGGMGAISEKLAEAVRRNGGRVIYRQEAARIRTENGRPVAVETKRGDSFPADLVFANLTPWNTAELLECGPAAFQRSLGPQPRDGWGAFMVYIGLDGAAVPADFPLHHQIISRRPFGNGNTVFGSLSPGWDAGRAPLGQRALTLSTHTKLEGWWQIYEHDRAAYTARKAELTDKMIAAVEVCLPGLRDAARLVLPGTPVTFQHFTRRKWGWVGGFPQTSLVRVKGPRIGQNMWMVGDSIFPGQSTAAVALGGLRVARMALRGMDFKSKSFNKEIIYEQLRPID